MLILGSFIFEDFEIPEKLPLGGSQMIAVHKLLGGARVVDAMGQDDRDISWSGRFQRTDAILRARAIDQMRISGQAVPLVVDAEFRLVLVKEFTWDYERFYQIPYSITCIPVSSASLFDLLDSLDVLVASDLGQAASLASSFVSSVF